MNTIVTGIHTDVGKTFVSAILAYMLDADYWKPIQAGKEQLTDSQTIQILTQGRCTIHPEAYCFSQPFSPHKAAQLDHIIPNEILLQPPNTQKSMIIEMAGGFLSPFYHRTQGDVFSSNFSGKWVLVSRQYLGSLNHTLLTLEAMINRNLMISGMILNEYSEDDAEWLMRTTQIPIIGFIERESSISNEIVKKYASSWSKQLLY